MRGETFPIPPPFFFYLSLFSSILAHFPHLLILTQFSLIFPNFCQVFLPLLPPCTDFISGTNKIVQPFWVCHFQIQKYLAHIYLKLLLLFECEKVLHCKTEIWNTLNVNLSNIAGLSFTTDNVTQQLKHISPKYCIERVLSVSCHFCALKTSFELYIETAYMRHLFLQRRFVIYQVWAWEIVNSMQAHLSWSSNFIRFAPILDQFLTKLLLSFVL